MLKDASPYLLQPTIAVLSTNFCTWQDSEELYEKSDVYRVNSTGDRTVPRSAPVLLADLQFPSQLFSEKQQLYCVKGTKEV